MPDLVGKVVGLVCDDQLFVKPIHAGSTYLDGLTVQEKPPYSRAKPCLLIPGERWEAGEWLGAQIRSTADYFTDLQAQDAQMNHAQQEASPRGSPR